MNNKNIIKYYVLCDSETKIYAFDRRGMLRIITNAPWILPYLFETRDDARIIALKNNGSVHMVINPRHRNDRENNM